MKLALSMVILGVALANACDAIMGKSDLLRVGVAVYWCVVSIMWALTVIEGVMG